MILTIIIPTYNNREVLPLTVAALFDQHLPVGITAQVIISDDGSADDTVAIADQWVKQSPWPARRIIGPHRGAAAARNRALQAAPAGILFFLGADIILLPGALMHHCTFHSQHPESAAGALGMVKWDPRLEPSPFMEWMVHGGQQNNYDALLGNLQADPDHFFYGAHLSVKKELVGGERFFERFTNYGWEDIEFGRRLKKRGLQLYVLHQAIGLHHHRYTVSDITARQRAVGAGLVAYQNLYPNEKLLPPRSRLRQWRRYFFVRPIVIAFLTALSTWACVHHRVYPKLFLRLTTAEFWYGARKVLNYFPH